MKKIFLIIEREFSSRVKKRSFLLMTLLTPLLFAGMMMIYVYMITMDDTAQKTIAVIDHSGLAEQSLGNTPVLTFTFLPAEASIDSLKQHFDASDLYALLVIGELDSHMKPDIQLLSNKQTDLATQGHIARALEKTIEEQKLKNYNIEGLDAIMKAVKTQLQVKTFVWGKDGKEKASDTTINMIISLVAGLLIYMFIFMFGSMVMRGVIEEKSSRIVEVIVSSVKPFQLMMGKILGVAAVGLLQFGIWVALTMTLSTLGAGLITKDKISPDTLAASLPAGAGTEALSVAPDKVADMLTALSNINFLEILVTFLLFFLLGYLLYASMFAAIGSAMESDADSQQLTLPVTAPVIIGMFIMVHAFQHPHSTLSVWGSIVPFTSPMVMMARVPFGVPFWQIALSLLLLLATFVLITWLSGKIYRVGILMYGKKTSLKELLKWIRFKN
jgi:ABC-2 type transport system permease protein